MFIAFTGPNIIAARHGGAHQWNTRLEAFFEMLYWSNLVQILYGPVILVVKLSILLQYLRIFVPTRRGNLGMYIGLCLVSGTHLVFYIVVTFIQIFSCRPREATWNKLIQDKYCLNLPAMFVASGVVNVVSDLIILVLPIHSIWKLQITTRQKMQVTAAFATGLLVCVASIARCYYIVKFFETEDQTWAIVPPGLCGIAEISLGIICTCLTTLPMFCHVIHVQLSRMSFFGYKIFGGSEIDPRTPYNSTASALRSKTPSQWNNESGDNNQSRKSYHELDDLQLSPRGNQMRVSITSPERARSGLERELEEGRILQTTIVEVEEKTLPPRNVTGKTYYDDT
ncbi:hypothetical protein HYALB_00010596 [Hymenoscyphus albidus]|uniref:Rhodopsin domain-containing protein n=1 Tax=Hymenoscyphus albidus TaxID=595503 RepID=A0A9N9M6N4_9HELO|nr:hypothetical protein HYALB_00010596 [Hymenoscyphus albidus]